MSNQATKKREWQSVLEEIKLENDPEKLSKKLQEVEGVILERLQALHQNSDDRKEQEALKEALFTLRIIKRDKLGFPDWQ
jgi:hypothetical protein